jgi:hypothetical protein
MSNRSMHVSILDKIYIVVHESYYVESNKKYLCKMRYFEFGSDVGANGRPNSRSMNK